MRLEVSHFPWDSISHLSHHKNPSAPSFLRSCPVCAVPLRKLKLLKVSEREKKKNKKKFGVFSPSSFWCHLWNTGPCCCREAVVLLEGGSVQAAWAPFPQPFLSSWSQVPCRGRTGAGYKLKVGQEPSCPYLQLPPLTPLALQTVLA